MASEQKKRAGSAGRSASSGSGSRSGGQKSGRSASQSKKKQPPQSPVRREVGALICLLLGIFAAIGYFPHDEGIFIDLLYQGARGLIGYGFFLMAPVLLVAAAVLFFHRGRPVRLRVWCALLFPVVMGAILHLFLAKATYVWDFAMLGALWKDGVALKSGGVLSGLLAQALIAVFSKIGAGVLLVLAGAAMIMVVFHITPMELWERYRQRPAYEEEPEPEPKPRVRERKAEKEQVPAPQPVRAQVPQIDIPVDEGPLVGKEPERKRLFSSGGRLFDRNAKVPAPDQVLRGAVPDTEAKQVPNAAPAAPEAASEPVPEQQEPAPVRPGSVQDAPVKVEIEREPAVQKTKKEETAQAAAEVAQDIEKRMEEAPAQGYQYPPVSLLHQGGGVSNADVTGELRANQQRLSDTIRSFGIEAQIVNVTRGPSVTRYELELDQGVRLNKLTNLADDIALALGAAGVRIAPIPDKISMVGIEVPNKLVSPVYIGEVIGSNEFDKSTSKVSFAVGKDIGGNCVVGNIAKLPHLLIAGTTGSGKSVCTNSLIISLLYKASPEEVRLIMVDPKMVELGIYNGIPHLLIPVVTDPKKAAGALQWAVTEMMKRYRAFSEVGVRDLTAYNALAERTEGMNKMPSVVVVIDELADLMLVAAKEVEESICRVAQMGRASGMHLIIATQRPSADVITGLMKANIPSRIAFAVASSLESRIILDTTGAEKLIGRGDMLYFPLGSGKPKRVQGCLISDEEVAAVVEFVKQSGSAEYDESVLHQIEQNVAEKEKGSNKGTGAAPEETGGDYDELLPSAIEVVVETGMASVSMLQRRLKLGYSRAARLVDQMEEKGVVGPFEGSKPRQVLITKEQWQEMQYRQNMPAPAAQEEIPLHPDMPPVSEPVPDELEFERDAFDQEPPF